jgi:Protein of unknown function VcgC/VcgE (DUF2780)
MKRSFTQASGLLAAFSLITACGPIQNQNGVANNGYGNPGYANNGLGMNVPNNQPAYTGQIMPQASTQSPMLTAQAVQQQLPQQQQYMQQQAQQMQQPSLVNMLSSQLGVNQQQATAGAGSIFALAQQNMSPQNFAQVSNAVPNMNNMLAAAPAMQPQQAAAPANNSMLGVAENILLANTQLGGVANLANTFQSLGMNGSMAGQFLPIILQYVQQQGGSGTMSLLQNALH